MVRRLGGLGSGGGCKCVEEEKGKGIGTEDEGGLGMFSGICGLCKGADVGKLVEEGS